MQKGGLNELLAYVNCYRHNSTDDAVRKVVITHFSQDDTAAAAKRLLVQEFHWVSGITQFTTERGNSSARQAHEAEIKDIICILDVVDTRNTFAGDMFVASNL